MGWGPRGLTMQSRHLTMAEGVFCVISPKRRSHLRIWLCGDGNSAVTSAATDATSVDGEVATNAAGLIIVSSVEHAALSPSTDLLATPSVSTSSSPPQPTKSDQIDVTPCTKHVVEPSPGSEAKGSPKLCRENGLLTSVPSSGSTVTSTFGNRLVSLSDVTLSSLERRAPPSIDEVRRSFRYVHQPQGGDLTNVKNESPSSPERDEPSLRDEDAMVEEEVQREIKAVRLARSRQLEI